MKKILFALLAISVLLMGCGGGGTSSPQASAGGSTATPTAAPTAASSVSASTQGGNTGAGDLAGKAVSELMQLGVPVECTFSQTNKDGIVFEGNFKIKGKKIRTSSKASGGTLEGKTIEMESISETSGSGSEHTTTQWQKNTFASIAGAEGMYDQSCIWVKTIYTFTSQATPAASAAATVDPDSIPPSNLRCNPAAFGDDIFIPAGRVCGKCEVYLNEQMRQMCENPTAACDSISDAAAKEQCIKTLGNVPV